MRIPAAVCGLTGLKVTEGRRLPLDGIVPLSHTLDTPGPMARSVADAVIMFEVLDGRHAGGDGRRSCRQATACSRRPADAAVSGLTHWVS